VPDDDAHHHAGQTINRIPACSTRRPGPTSASFLVEEQCSTLVSQSAVPKNRGARQISRKYGLELRLREGDRARRGDGRSFYDIIDANASFGWHTLRQSLTPPRSMQIEDETALLYATNRNKLTRLLRLSPQTTCHL